MMANLGLRNFRYELESFERALKAVKYESLFAPASSSSPSGLPKGALSLYQIASILSSAISDGPHGLSFLLSLKDLDTELPSLPTPLELPTSPPPPDYAADMAKKLMHRFEKLTAELEATRNAIAGKIRLPPPKAAL